MKKIYLITNDKIWLSEKKYTSNNDLNNIISCLNTNYELNLVCRKSKKKLNFSLNSRFNYFKFNQIKEKKINIFLLSITPFNFFVLFYFLLIKRINFKGFVYLRSDGFLEYKYKYGLLGYYIYYLMFFLIKKKLKILSCSKNFTNVNVKNVLHPSELDLIWLKESNVIQKYKTDFLYVGRFKKEKGSHYLVNIFQTFLKDYNLTIVGNDKKSIPSKFFSDNIKYKNSITDINELIKVYDTSKIFILPSYTEGFPKVISEALARLKPVIIFEEINYVINGREGIFVCKREMENLRKTIDLILGDYDKIQKKIKQNFFYTKDNFKKELLISIENDLK
tara:strand:+ start:1916 stop:2920 length:1005 start_codon:yes stop_codon:yes gene_type:complete